MPHNFPIQRIADLDFQRPPEIGEANCRPPSEFRRLNLNESLVAPSPHALAAMHEALDFVEAYTDHSCQALADVLVARTGIPADRISFGNGSGELLTSAAAIAIDYGDEAVFPTPTFPTCAKGVGIAGGLAIHVPVASDGVNDVSAMLAAITDKTRLFYLCTPNNPTGGVLGEADLKRAIAEVPETCLLVIDEAYHEFAKAEGAPDVLSLLEKRKGPWVVSRSFSKAYCMAGMRIGYIFCSHADIRDGLWALRGNFNVNRIALAGAVAALKDDDHLRRTLNAVIEQRERLATGLTVLGFTPFPSQANFLTVQCPRPAGELADGLMERGLMVQALPWPRSGDNNHGSLRITIGTRQDIDDILLSLENMLADK